MSSQMFAAPDEIPNVCSFCFEVTLAIVAQ